MAANKTRDVSENAKMPGEILRTCVSEWSLLSYLYRGTAILEQKKGSIHILSNVQWQLCINGRLIVQQG